PLHSGFWPQVLHQPLSHVLPYPPRPAQTHRHLINAEGVFGVEILPQVSVNSFCTPIGADEPNGVESMAAVCEHFHGGEEVVVMTLAAPVQLVGNAEVSHDGCLLFPSIISI